MDRFVTTLNVLGDGIGAGIVHELSKKELEDMDNRERSQRGIIHSQHEQGSNIEQAEVLTPANTAMDDDKQKSKRAKEQKCKSIPFNK